LEDFKSGSIRVLIATDVASRGLDVKDITYVESHCAVFFSSFHRELDEINVV